jgi:hypothetical protein
LFPLQRSAVHELRWQRGGVDELIVARKDTGWQVTWPAPGPGRSQVVEDLLDVLAAARWHRRAEAGRALPIARTLIVDGVAIGLGGTLGEQRWLQLRGDAFLVDAWVARVLDVDAAALRDRAPLPDASSAPILELHATATAAGPELELVMQGRALVSPRRQLLDPELAQRLRDRLAALLVTSPSAAGSAASAASSAASDAGSAASDAPAGEAPAWTVRIAGGKGGEATLSGRGECAGVAATASVTRSDAGSVTGSDAGSVTGSDARSDAESDPGIAVVSSRLGAGCLERASWRELAELAGMLASPAGADARPAAGDAAEVVSWTVDSSGGGRLELVHHGAAWTAQRDGVPYAVDQAAVARVVEALTQRWPVTDAPLGPVKGELSVQLRAGEAVRLIVTAPRADGRSAPSSLVLARQGEGPSLRAPPGLALDVATLAARLADLAIWQLEPTAVASLALDGRELRRGAVLGEWLSRRGELVPATTATMVEALVAELSTLRAVTRQPAPASTRGDLVHLLVRMAPGPARGPQASPAAEPAQHRLDVILGGDRCLGSADGADAQWAPSLCAQLEALRRQLSAEPR